MKPLRCILVGIDVEPGGKEISVGSRNAALQARALAEKSGASILLLHSGYRERDSALEEPSAAPGPETVAALEMFAQELGEGGAQLRLELTEEPAWLGLIRAIEEERGELVMVAKRSHFARDGRHLGTVASKLIRKCPAPVWIVHSEYGLIYETVLAATDLTPVGDLATRTAAWVAGLFGAELHIVHAYQKPMSIQLAEGRLSDREIERALQEIADRAQRHIEDALGEEAMAGRVSIHVGCTAPALAIEESVSRLHPDLLVMGSLSRTGFAGVLMGNTAERVLERVDCSLLTLKPDDFESPVAVALRR